MEEVLKKVYDVILNVIFGIISKVVIVIIAPIIFLPTFLFHLVKELING